MVLRGTLKIEYFDFKNIPQEAQVLPTFWQKSYYYYSNTIFLLLCNSELVSIPWTMKLQTGRSRAGM